MSVCPNGHQSATDDFCDTCGAPIAPAVATPPAAPTPAPPQAGAPPKKACPNCGGQNATDALFCEACGYDFTTGQQPPPPPAASASSAPATSAAAASASPALTGADWVAEIWIDPDFFAAQQAAGVCPTGGAPTVVPLPGTEATIGRRSSSGTAVDIDCSGDSATSHRHAKLTLDHDRWYVEDLGSLNGTFVGSPTLMPPTPLTAGERHELGDSERVYIGAWTRIVIRRATPEERGAGSLSI